MILPQIEQQIALRQDGPDASYPRLLARNGDATGAFPRLGDPDPAGRPGDTIIPTFMCPSDPTRQIGTEGPTNYAGIWGDVAASRGGSGHLFAAESHDGTYHGWNGQHRHGRRGVSRKGDATAVTGAGWYNGERCRRWAEETGYCGAATNVTPNYGMLVPGLPETVADLITWVDMHCGGCFQRDGSPAHLQLASRWRTVCLCRCLGPFHSRFGGPRVCGGTRVRGAVRKRRCTCHRKRPRW